MQLAQDLLQLDVTALPDVHGVVSGPPCPPFSAPRLICGRDVERLAWPIGMNDGVHRRWTMVFGHEPPCYNVPSHRNMLKVLPSKVQLLLKYEESSFSRFVAKRVGQAPHPSIIRHFIFVPNRRFPPFRQLASASCMKTRGAGCSFRSRNLSSTKDNFRCNSTRNLNVLGQLQVGRPMICFFEVTRQEAMLLHRLRAGSLTWKLVPRCGRSLCTS